MLPSDQHNAQASATDQDKKDFTVSPPAISLPKGGGAIRGIVEKFAANPVTGTGSMSVPIPTSPGRSGFGPQLSLNYDSGAGNGPFGFGWNLSIPSITRKTDKGLPQYHDDEESDVFILSGAEDLVPVLEQNAQGEWVRKVSEQPPHAPEYRIDFYRPRIEGVFARVERWTNQNDPEDVCWRSISRDNITTWYGKTRESRIAKPADPTRIFSWLICQSYDDKGNAIIYEYKAENSDDVDQTQAHERNRTELTRSANRYLKCVKYGNRVPNRNDDWKATDPSKLSEWMFEVVFDYGEGYYEDLPLDANISPEAQHRFVAISLSPTGQWPVRKDPFSSYRAGFEMRTYRLCQRVLMFHHFPDELGIDNYLVRSTSFTYQESPIASFITGVTQSGYVHKPISTHPNRFLKKSLPPLEFEYSQPIIDDTIREIDPESLENLPYGIDGTLYRFVDLDGEGVSGILTEQAGAWFYKPNLGEGKFGSLETVALKPSLADLTSGGQQLIDLAGDGQLDLVTFQGPASGFYERTQNGSWADFRTFASLPNIDWNDPNLRLVDLTGDGHADILVTEECTFTWHLSMAEEGFGEAERVYQSYEEENGPRLVFSDSTQSIYLADLSGDGLIDLARVRNGEVCYWPSLGYGCFGAKVTMDNAPWFDYPEWFDQRRLHLADIDGSGTTDIIYLGRDGVYLYFNQTGNGWSELKTLTGFPKINGQVAVAVMDLLGNGTACLVWSLPLPGDTAQPMRYIDLMGGGKPHLLIRSVSNLGAETRVHYVSSTNFYLADKLAGKPWITRIPFPVHVVERVETFDHISRNHFVTRYAYHHGYFDGVEREFRGFGMVEQWDTEEFAALSASDEFPDATNIDEASHVPPVLTKTWFHTGVFLGRNRVSNFFAGLLNDRDVGDYYREPAWRDDDEEAKKRLLPDTVLPTGLTVDEEREACRALKGSMLRQEVYALDGTDKQEHPYTVTEQNFTVRILQPRYSKRRPGVIFTHTRESISYHYERNPTDPRIGHTLTLEVDEFGNVLQSAEIGYGRRQPDPDLPPADQARQAQILITYTENRVTNAVDASDDHRTPLPCESRTYELTGSTLPADRSRFTLDEILDAGVMAIPLDYENDPTAGQLEKRLIEHVRSYYRRNNLSGMLPLRELQSLALPFQSYKLAFTPGLVAKVYGGRVSDAMLANEGRYVHTEGDANWWIPSGQIFYSRNPGDTPAQELAYARQHFFLPHRYRDPFHTNAVSTEGFVTYDAYDLLVEETRDALANRVTVGERDIDPTQPLLRRAQDYRVLQPSLVMDPNRNRSAVAFDAIGMVIGTAVMGKPAPAPVQGDTLNGFTADLTRAESDQFLANPKGPMAATLLAGATSRVITDLTAYFREPDLAKKPPAFAATLARETHVSEPLPPGGLRIQTSFSYSDGFGREVQKKVQAEPGPVPARDANGAIVVDANNQPQMTPNSVSPRWVGSGWTVFNNKGKPVRQYEPYFTDTHLFEFDVRIGKSPILFYDPVARVVATLHPNRTWEKVVFGPWRETSWDVSDTLLVAAPDTDKNLGDFFARLPSAEYTPTWHALRTDPAHAAALAARYPDANLRANEQAAARQSETYARTPTVAHADSLGRTIITVAHNRFQHSNAAAATEEFYATHVVFDIEGNLREVIDAKGRLVVRYDYDMLGNRIHQSSMEAGERWTLGDVAGKPLYEWDSRGYRFRSRYDVLQRPTESFLLEGAGPEVLVGRSVYGESRANPETSNLRGRVVELFDQAGLVTSDQYDFKGNILSSARRLVDSVQVRGQPEPAYKNRVDWSGIVTLMAEKYVSRTRFDALNRPTQLIAPHSDEAGAKVNVIQPAYNDANLLERMDVWLDHGNVLAALIDPAVIAPSSVGVNNIDYDAKAQRLRTDYSNGISTCYSYDLETFRLIHLRTEETGPGRLLQNLHYTFDSAGNVTHIRDNAQQTIFFANARVEPSSEYTYDALFRLIEATGREHLGQVGGAPIPHSYNDAPRVGRAGIPHPNDGQALGRYIERFFYDQVGNISTMRHAGTDPQHPGWTRSYAYNEPSQLEPGKVSNRLTSTTVGNGAPVTASYSNAGDGYDNHGNMLKMPQLQIMQWNERDQLQMTQRQAINRTDADGVQRQGERTWYVYDAGGQRIRKVTELANGQLKDERIYLGGLEIYRKFIDNLVRETIHIMDDKQRIAMVETRVQGNEHGVPVELVRYQLGNHLGSSCLEVDDQARVLSYEEYTSFGSTSYQAVRNHLQMPRRYRFTGRERDEESGLYYHEARYYAPWICRWITADPMGIIDGMNIYAYVNDAPINQIDPSGTQGEEEALNFTIHGKAGHRSRPISMDIDEPRAVGERGISEAEARARALDVNNREFLDPQTNRGTKHLGRSSRPMQPARAPVSVAENPNALITHRFSEITEMREIFEEARRSIRNPDRLRPTKLKARINSKIWEIIKTGNSPEAARVRAALERLGFENVRGRGYVLRARPPIVEPSETPRTNSRSNARVVGPATRAVVGGAVVAGIAGRTITQLHEGKPVEAAKTAAVGGGLYWAASKVPALIPLMVMKSTIDSYDKEIEQKAFEDGDWWANATGSTTVGAVASAASATGRSTFEGTFGVTGRAIGEGAAVVYIRLTDDKYTLVPWKSQLWSDIFD